VEVAGPHPAWVLWRNEAVDRETIPYRNPLVAERAKGAKVKRRSEIENSAAPIGRVLKRLAGRYGRLHVCFEADCMVVAPAQNPK
jgi:hypothetical protein